MLQTPRVSALVGTSISTSVFWSQHSCNIFPSFFLHSFCWRLLAVGGCKFRSPSVCAFAAADRCCLHLLRGGPLRLFQLRLHGAHVEAVLPDPEWPAQRSCTIAGGVPHHPDLHMPVVTHTFCYFAIQVCKNTVIKIHRLCSHAPICKEAYSLSIFYLNMLTRSVRLLYLCAVALPAAPEAAELKRWEARQSQGGVLLCCSCE